MVTPEILLLFQRRCELYRDAEEAFQRGRDKGFDNEDERIGSAIMNYAREVERRIELAPASGAAGLAIKTFLLIHNEAGDGVGLGDDIHITHGHAGQAALVRDLIRFAPNLAPLCAEYLASLDAANG